MAKLNTFSLVDQAEQEIARQIDLGKLEAGQNLVIAKLAQEFGTSIVPIREAMARLHAQKVLRFEPNKGYSVVPSPSPADFVHMQNARLAIEIGAIELSQEMFTAADIAELRGINTQIKQTEFSEDVRGLRIYVDLNAQFHRTLILRTGNQYLIDAYDEIGYHKLISRTLQGNGVSDIQRRANEHDRILDALEAGDKATCLRELIDHIVFAREEMLRLQDGL